MSFGSRRLSGGIAVHTISGSAENLLPLSFSIWTTFPHSRHPSYLQRVLFLSYFVAITISFRKRGPDQVVGDGRSEHSRDVQFSSVSVIIDSVTWLALMSPLRSFAVAQLQKTRGRILIVSSQTSQLRMPFRSEYCTSKYALVRFSEFIIIGKPLSHSINTIDINQQPEYCLNLPLTRDASLICNLRALSGH